MSLLPWRWPPALRIAAYAGAVAVLLYLCLAPSNDLPTVNLWDKAEHSLAWCVLTGLGLVLWPARPARVTAFAFAFGGLVEVLQGDLPFGRDADWRDWAADSTGVGAALLVWWLVMLAMRMAAPRTRDA
ncbi:MAG: hypothetical protein JWQ97_3958 [Phenylobacterium sp.]|nr:hypothetical protein [Phenylobacterium sp.]